jgi:hypothetical protein
MRKTLAALIMAAGIAIVCGQSVGAVPGSATSVNQAAAASPLQLAQYDEFPTRHGVVKCYRDFIIGPYRCHHFRTW